MKNLASSFDRGADAWSLERPQEAALLRALLNATDVLTSVANMLGHRRMAGLARSAEMALVTLRNARAPLAQRGDELQRAIGALGLLRDEVLAEQVMPLDLIDLIKHLELHAHGGPRGAADAPASQRYHLA